MPNPTKRLTLADYAVNVIGAVLLIAIVGILLAGALSSVWGRAG